MDTRNNPPLQRVLSNGLALLKTRTKPVYSIALIRLAAWLRQRATATTFIAITGSSGKTTTKDLVYEILRADASVRRNDDTNNQLYSVARTLLGCRKSTGFLVQEIGASATNDMNDSLSLLIPDIGVIVTIGREHHKAFRNREQVAAEKAKIIRGLPADGTAVLNFDDELIRQMTTETAAHILSFGFSNDCDVRGSDVHARWPQRVALTVTCNDESVRCETRFCGEHTTQPILAALATAVASGVRLQDAAARISGVEPTTARMMPFLTDGGIQFIRDDWKAPFWSMELPIRFMRDAEAKRKIIVIGTIADTFGNSNARYRTVAESALAAADIVCFYGPNATKAERVRQIPENKTLATFTDIGSLNERLKSILKAGDLVLLKGSGADHLARLALSHDGNVQCWRNHCGRENLCDVCPLLTVP